VLEALGLVKTYRMGRLEVSALRGIDLFVPEGDFVAVMGPSGSGKSTLMNIIGCLDRPTSGRYLMAGQDISLKREHHLAAVRNQFIGFVFQTFNLLPRLTALENVELPLLYRGLPRRRRLAMAAAALASVGLSDRARHRPPELSGGQQQRVAVARALAGSPRILLADEPTGNLDSRSGEELMALLQELNRRGVTILVVTHDENIANHCRRVVRLRDGRIVEERAVAVPLDARALLDAQEVRT
jgi:putative ABC transport system ATP-binding protein